MVESQVAALLPVIAGLFAVPQFVPQLRRVRRGRIAGVSWTWAMMTCVNNVAWVAYFTWSAQYTALIPATAAVIVSGLLAVNLAARMSSFPRRSALIVAGWLGVMALAAVLFGRHGLGTSLAVAFFLQVAPSVWTAYRSSDISGISAGTWLLVLGELACFGLFGVVEHDWNLIALGLIGVSASLLILARVAVMSRRATTPTTATSLQPESAAARV